MRFVLETPQARIAITDYGARLVSIETPDRNGRFGHILLGFDALDAYREAGGSFGAVLGRYANRIADARFSLDGQTWPLTRNDPGGILHGGDGGFGNRLWTLVSRSSGACPEIVFTRISPDGEEGFPGTLTATATYRLHGDRLTLELAATTDAATVVNLSSHPYFHLGDLAEEDVLDHEFIISADRYLPTDSRQIPTGELRPVAGSVFDFRNKTSLRKRIRRAEPQLLLAHGYDHCFILNKTGASGPEFAARAFSPRTGRVAEIFTTQPGLQFYSGNNLTGAIAGRNGVALRQSSGFALEAQNFPNAPNTPDFPSAVLRPGERYHHIIVYQFAAI